MKLQRQETIPLREHFEARLELMGATGELRAEVAEIRTLINAQSALTNAQFVTYRALIDSQAEKVALALTAADKAVTKAEIATEKRFESVNEFRKTLSDQTASFLPRTEYGAAHQALIDKLTDLAARMDKTEGRSGGLSDGTRLLIQMAGLLIAAITLYLALK